MKIPRRVGLVFTMGCISLAILIVVSFVRSWFSEVNFGGMTDDVLHGQELEQVIGLFSLPMAGLFPIIIGAVIIGVSILVSLVYWIVYWIIKYVRGRKGLIPVLSEEERKWERKVDFRVCLTTLFCVIAFGAFRLVGLGVAIGLSVAYWNHFLQYIKDRVVSDE